MTTWDALDLGPLLAGIAIDPEPTILRRMDGHALLYKGKVHSFAGESESLKTWIALLAAVESLCVGEHVLFLDFEDSPQGVVNRLLAMGVPRTRIAECFHYVRPAEELGETARTDLGKLIERCPPTLTILDGITEAMTLLGLDIVKNADAAKFSTELLRPMAATGAAVVSLDHLPKDSDGRTRTAIGAVHKLNAIDGAAYTVDLVEPFGRGRTGKATLHLAKDRPGFVRQHAAEGRVAGVLTLASVQGGAVRATLELPAAGQDAEWKPTVLMQRVSAVLIANPAGMSGAQVETAVRGKARTIRAALEFLLGEGYASVERKGPAKIFRSLKPYPSQP